MPDRPHIYVDADACPGGRWSRLTDTTGGHRRLREYGALTIEGDRVHLFWAHAPQAPSRVWTATVTFQD